MPRSDGYKNLKPWKERTSDERRSIMQKAGIASGKKRREIKAARECAKILFSQPLDALQKRSSKCLASLDEEDQHQLMAELVSMHKQALKGNVRAAELLLKVSGEMPADKTELTGVNGSPLIPDNGYNFSGYTPEQMIKMSRDYYADKNRV